MLEIEGLRVDYDATRAVDGVDLSVGVTGAVALLGPNGAGKTSTLNAISGMVPFEGSIRFDGTNIRRMPAEKVARAGLIHVPEGRRIFPTLSVHENLQVGLTARAGRDDGFSIDDVYDLLPQLRSIAGRAGWALSGGEQQMVALGRGLVGAPRLLLLDEPSLGLAPIIVIEVLAALEQVAQRIPLLLVEQNSTAAMRICHRASVLVKGSIVLEGTAEELGDREALIDSYLGTTSIDEAQHASPGDDGR